MKNWKNILISPDHTIREAIKRIDAYAMQCVLIISEQNRLLGMITDGDIRRGILKGISLDERVRKIMNTTPITASDKKDEKEIISIMKNKKIRHLPIIDKDGLIIDFKKLDDLMERKTKKNWAIIMAGGLGSRLRPLTDIVPKPLIKIGNLPILEMILKNLKDQGFERFYITVHYKAEMIKEYFKDGSQWDIDIRYIHEKEQLGTAGALSLLPEKPKESIIVMNSDLLTTLNFNQLMDFHMKSGSQATMCVRQYDFQVPYGVIHMKGNRLIGLEEKPIQRMFVNAGIYILEPSVLDQIPKESNYDMTTLFKKLIDLNQKLVVYPILEYWLDIGRFDDLQRAKKEYGEVFT